MRWIICTIGFCFIACSRNPSPDAPPLPTAGDAPLDAAEITRINAMTLYETVQRLRPGYLHVIPFATRGQVGPPATAVYINGFRVGGLEALQLIPPEHVASVRLLRPIDAVTTLGQGLGGGAILVELRR